MIRRLLELLGWRAEKQITCFICSETIWAGVPIDQDPDDEHLLAAVRAHLAWTHAGDVLDGRLEELLEERFG